MCGRVMKRWIIAWLGAGLSLASAETLHVLVLEVDQRLVAPTCERAIGGDPEALGEVIGKLRKLVAGGSVSEWLSLEIERSDPLKRIETGRMKYVDVPKRDNKRVKVGHEHRWSRSETYVSRNLKLSRIMDADHLHRFGFHFYHLLHDHWTLSAGLRTPKGALFVFEKLSETDAGASDPKWMVSSLSEKRSSSLRADTASAIFLNSPMGRAGLVRIPDSESFGASAEFDDAVHTSYSQGFSVSSAAFQAWRPKEDPQLKLKFPERSGVDMNLVVEQGTNRLTAHSAKHVMPIEKIPSVGGFVALQRDNTRQGTTTRSAPSQKEKPEYELRSLVIGRGEWD